MQIGIGLLPFTRSTRSYVPELVCFHLLTLEFMFLSPFTSGLIL